MADLTSPLVVVALGSWEQHGPHLPLDTDTRIAEELVSRLTSRLPDSVQGPAISVSSSGEHAGFAGTLSVGGRVVVDTVVELVRSADWAEGIVIVNGHGGNAPYLERARSLVESEGRNVFTWSPPLVDTSDSHAGYVETSLMMAIDPFTVRVDRMVEGSTAPLNEMFEKLRNGGVASVSRNGVLGDPRTADASLGRELLAAWEDLLAASVSAWRNGFRDASR